MELFDRIYQKFLLPIFVFIGKILNNVWLLFKKIFLSKYIRSGAAILQTVWPLLLVLIVNYLFLNLMDQSQDLLDSLMQDFVYSVGAFTCLLLYGLTVWYTTRIVFLLKDQSELIHPEKSITESVDLDAQYIIYNPIDSSTLSQFTKWTPISLGVIPFLSLGLAFGKVEPTFLALAIT